MDQLKRDTCIIVCSRSNSRRLPDKPWQMLPHGELLIDALLRRLEATGIPVILAVPSDEADRYAQIGPRHPGVEITTGSAENPFERMYLAAMQKGFKHVIRVTHDKVFVDPSTIISALREYKGIHAAQGVRYLYSSHLPAGAGFEIIDRELLERARTRGYHHIEHISYAARACIEPGERELNWIPPKDYIDPTARLLIDYPEDLELMRLLYKELGKDATLRSALTYLSREPWAKRINALPDVTVYTCAYNAEGHIKNAISSIIQQYFQQEDTGSNLRIEYILYDDGSTDGTYREMLKATHDLPWCRVLRSEQNLGLATASNKCIDEARGDFVLRIDADDFFTNLQALGLMVEHARMREIDALYASYYEGSPVPTCIRTPEKHHHVGCALFRRRALNHVRFTDGLRGYDGADLYRRLRDQVRVDYLLSPMWLYTQRPQSMSQTNQEMRARILGGIEG